MTPFATSSRWMTPISAYCLRAWARCPCAAVEVAERARRTAAAGSRRRLGSPARSPPRVPASRLDLGQRVERVGVAGEGGAAQRGIREPPAASRAGRPVELAELDARPGGRPRADPRAASTARRIAAIASCGRAEQLARVRDARVGSKARPELRHRVEGAECCVVAAELDEGVADHAVRAGAPGCEPQGAAAETERLAGSGAGRARASRARRSRRASAGASRSARRSARSERG